MAIFVFDAYGTLFNVHAAIARFRAEAGPEADRMSEIWRAKQLEYSWTLTLAGHYVDFWTLTERALDYALTRFPSVDKALRPQLLEAYFKLDAFPDARAALRALKAKGHKTGILSNGSPNMLKGAVDAAGVGGDLDAVLSVDALKMFKPRPEVYGLVTDHYKCKPADVTFVSSNRWDVMASVSVGFRGLWVNRGKMPDEYFDFPPHAGIGGFERTAGAGLIHGAGLARPAAPDYMRRTAPAPPHAIHHFHQQSLQDLRDRVPGAQGDQSRHPARRDFRAARAQRRRQDHADRHRLRHSQCRAQGKVTVDGHDIINDYRAARSLIGLVPQELHTDAFESVWATVTFQPRPVQQADATRPISKRCCSALSLWDKKDAKIMTLSGGMKRRVLIAKALSHEPQILFLDEPTAGVDVELRKDMWQVVRELRASGVTIILTTHYIEEAEDMADRVGVINKGEIILVENKAELMRKLGKKRLDPAVCRRGSTPLPAALAALQPHARRRTARAGLHLRHQGRAHRRHHAARRTEQAPACAFRDLQTTQSSLEEIFVGLVSERGAP